MLDAIKYYTIVDIKKLYSIACQAEITRPDDLERCSTALASLLFATIECLGVLLNKEITNQTYYDKRDDPKPTPDKYYFSDGRKNMNIFFEEIIHLGLDKIDTNDVTIISLTMRNGFIHSLFPKLGMGIGFNLQDAYKKEILTVIDDNLNLNVAYLTRYVLNALEEIKLKYTSDIFFKEMVDRNSQWYKEKQEQNIKKDSQNKLRDALQKYPNVLAKHFNQL